MPFKGRNVNQLSNKILRGKVTFQQSIWANVSEEAKDMVLKLLDTNPNTRYSAERALLHPWFKMNSDFLKSNDLLDTVPKIKDFNAKMKLKGVMIVARLSTTKAGSHLLRLKAEHEDHDDDTPIREMHDHEIDTHLEIDNRYIYRTSWCIFIDFSCRLDTTASAIRATDNMPTPTESNVGESLLSAKVKIAKPIHIDIAATKSMIENFFLCKIIPPINTGISLQHLNTTWVG